MNHNPGQQEPPTAILNAPKRVRNDEVNDAYVPSGMKVPEEREHENKIHTEALFNSINQFKKAKRHGEKMQIQDVDMSDGEDKENEHFS